MATLPTTDLTEIVSDIKIVELTSQKEGNVKYNKFVVTLVNGLTIETFLERAELKVIELLLAGVK